MPWKIKSAISERLRLVKLVLQARQGVAYLCRSFGISRKTAYKWKARFLEGGRRGLVERSRRPRNSPGQTSPQWVQRVRQVRRRHRHWGGQKIRAYLRRRYPRKRLPAARTITLWVRRLGLTKVRRRRPPKGPVVQRRELTAARRSNQVWTVDFKGWFRTGDGRRVEPLTVRDQFSRYVLEVRLLADQRWEPVQAVFMRLFAKYGLPKVIRVDNGGPFASTGPGGLSRLSAWWTALGVAVEFIRPGHPEDNGAHEQFHRVLKAETAKPASSTLRAQQRRTNRWIKIYNGLRGHEALGQRPPAEVYRRSQRPYRATAPELKYAMGWKVRRVRSNGQIKWQGRKRFIGEALVGYVVGLKSVAPSRWQVYFGSVLVGELRASDPFGLRPSASARRDRIIPPSKV